MWDGSLAILLLSICMMISSFIIPEELGLCQPDSFPVKLFAEQYTVQGIIIP